MQGRKPDEKTEASGRIPGLRQELARKASLPAQFRQSTRPSSRKAFTEKKREFQIAFLILRSISGGKFRKLCAELYLILTDVVFAALPSTVNIISASPFPARLFGSNKLT